MNAAPLSDPRRALGRRVFVAGAGIMGSGIAADCAVHGFFVTLEDVDEERSARGRANALRALDHQVQKGRLSQSAREEAAGRIESAIGLRRVGSAEIVVECAPENLSLKRQLFQEIEAGAGADALLASNTSSLPITSIAQGLKDPSRVIGVHFFNPVLQMPLVEIIPGLRTPPEIIERARAFALGLDKRVVLSKDTPGFVTTRAVAVLVNEAAWMLYEGVATAEDIDTAYTLGFHHPMGPFRLADLIGLDTAVAILDVLWDGFRDPKYRVCPLLRSMVAAGRLGRKSGEGFYAYPKDGAER